MTTGDGPQIAVAGAAVASEELRALAHEVGRSLGRAGAILLTGGRGGVMAAASAGARQAQALTIGLLPGADAAQSPPNRDLSVTLFTGLGQARNLALVLSADAVIAIGGGWGTLSEIALALKHQVPVVTLGSWKLDRPDGVVEPNLQSATSASEAVEKALILARPRRKRRSPKP